MDPNKNLMPDDSSDNPDLLARLGKPAPNQIEILKALQEANPRVDFKKLFANVPLDRPRSWSKNSNAPYYNEHFATLIKPVLDGMIEDQQPRRFLYSNYPRVRPNTLYTRILQSIQYLIEFMDTPDQKYAKFKKSTQLCKKQSGILLRWLHDPREQQMMAEVVADKAEIVRESTYLDVVTNFIEDTTNVGTKKVSKIELTDEAVSQIEGIVAGAKNVRFTYNTGTLTLFKFTDEQIAELDAQ